MHRHTAIASVLASLVVASTALLAAGTQEADLKSLKGAIKVDGSSTVYPITEAVAEEFGNAAERVRVTVGVSGTGGGFKLHLMELASGQVTALTDTSADERPSFAPNSRLIVYATLAQGREALMTTTLDGRIKARLAGQGGDIREPDWGPGRP